MNIIKIRIQHGGIVFRDVLICDEESLESLHSIISVIYHRDDYEISEYQFYKNQKILSNNKDLELRSLNFENGDELIYSGGDQNHEIIILETLKDDLNSEYPICIDGFGNVNNEEFSIEDINNRLHFKGKYRIELTLDNLAEILGLPEKLTKRKFEIIEKDHKSNLWQENNRYYADIKGFRALIQNKSITEYIEVGKNEGKEIH